MNQFDLQNKTNKTMNNEKKKVRVFKTKQNNTICKLKNKTKGRIYFKVLILTCSFKMAKKRQKENES